MHARALLGQHEFAAGEILAGLRQQDRHLQGKSEIAVEVLMEAVEVAGAILQEKRRRPRLAAFVAKLEEGGVVIGIAPCRAHAFVPVVGDAGQPGIERGAQATDQIRQRIAEIAVLALAEAMAGHHHMAAEMVLMRIETGDLGALLG
ncbi:hypothetical protein X750_03335 [Mesorhizobium sp. LNJC394B00]|nr:hypothetical protein X750_03335 [Mesorhizobium sp. LNJC394B00]